MADPNVLADRFEAHRAHLRSVAYRLLGSLSEADDAVQDAWLRLSRADTSEVVNLGGWLTTVVARVCLDMLRARTARREESLDSAATGPRAGRATGGDPEEEAILADTVGLALLVVLDTLVPAERLAFVLHDLFALPFEEIAPIVDRSPAATRQLASRARRRVRGAPPASVADRSRQRAVVDAFLAASRAGDFDALLTVLDPDVVFRADRIGAVAGKPWEVHGAQSVARTFARRAQGARPALVSGAVGAIVAPLGRLAVVLDLTVRDGKIVGITATTDPAHLRRINLAVLAD
ncbi:MAG: sigma-70 family RNA polymerase sigma factor [Thermomicrobiales bacterium]|jgi:RNA polymerase sigma-70 factor (ECF subfamily)